MARIRPPEYKYYRRARERALVRLANAYPNQYREYLEEEKADELVKSSALSVTDRTISSVDIRATAAPARPSSGDEGENEGNYGGEA